jgi:hypothetical protein
MIRSFAALLLVLGMLAHSASAQEASITEWRKDRETVPELPSKSTGHKKDAGEINFPRWSFGLNGGYAYRLFRAGMVTSHDEQQYLKDLKSGIAFGGDIAYFPWKHVGFGLRYEMYKASAKMDSLQSEKVTIQHLSGALIHRSFLKNGKTAILTSLLLGCQPYENKSTVGAQSIHIFGQNHELGHQRRHRTAHQSQIRPQPYRHRHDGRHLPPPAQNRIQYGDIAFVERR